jgi:hypothetical protein
LLRADLDEGQADAGHAQHRGAVPPDGGDGLVDICTFLGGELTNLTGDPGDQPSDPGDVLGRWQGLGPGPFLDVGGGEDPFPVA